MLGIRDDNPSSVAIFLLASISFVRSSPDISIGGLGGRGAAKMGHWLAFQALSLYKISVHYSALLV